MNLKVKITRISPMDDIKRPPKQYLDGTADEPKSASNSMSQPSANLESKGPSHSTGSVKPPSGATTPEPTAGSFNSSPVSLEDLDTGLDAKPTPDASQKVTKDMPMPDPFILPEDQDSTKPQTNDKPEDESSKMSVDKPSEDVKIPVNSNDQELNSTASTAVDSSPHVYDPSANNSQAGKVEDGSESAKPSEQATVATEKSQEDVVVKDEGPTSYKQSESIAAASAGMAAKPETQPAEAPAQPETDNVHIPAAPDLSEHRADLVDGKLETKAGSIPVSELPPAPDLSDGKKGKVSKAPTDHPKKKVNWIVMLIAFLLALALAGGAGYAYWQKSKDDSKTPAVTQPAEQTDETTKDVSTEDIEKTTDEIDNTLKQVEETEEAVNSDLTDSGLGL